MRYSRSTSQRLPVEDPCPRDLACEGHLRLLPLWVPEEVEPMDRQWGSAGLNPPPRRSCATKGAWESLQCMMRRTTTLTTSVTRTIGAGQNGGVRVGTTGGRAGLIANGITMLGDANGTRDTLPEILPDFVQGWLLFVDSGLDTLERNVLHAKLKGEFGVRAVEAALRKDWTDHDLRRRDQEKGRHMANLADDEEALLGEFDLDALEAEGFSPEELDIMAAEQEKMEEGLALINEGRRTLKEARNRQHAVKMSRQYYAVPSTTMGGGGSGFRRDPFKPRPGDGKYGIKCLRCGGPHKVAVCPEKNRGEVAAPKAQAHSAEEDATFTFFVAEALDTSEGESFLTTGDLVEQGKAVIDCGATKTVGSIHALEKIMAEHIRKNGSNHVERVDFADQPVFNFGNSSRNRCASTAQMSVPLDGKLGSLRVHALDAGSSPVLLSVQSLKQLGAMIDFEGGLAVFRKIAPDKVIRLEQTEAGHFVMPLTSDIFERAVKVRCAIPSLQQYL